MFGGHNGAPLVKRVSNFSYVHFHRQHCGFKAKATVRPVHFTYGKAPENVDDLFCKCGGSEPGQDEVKRTRLALHTSEMQGALARRQLGNPNVMDVK